MYYLVYILTHYIQIIKTKQKIKTQIKTNMKKKERSTSMIYITYF